MPSPARWSRSLQREWQWQWHEHPGRLRSVLLAWLLLSGSLAGLLWQQRWQLLQQRQNRQMQTDLGLLELRINSHRITALDWGHWDPLYAYAGGEDPGFVQRELSNSSIVEDDQMLLLVDPQFKPLLAKGRGIESGIPERLSRCLQGHLRQLGARTSSLEDPHRAFGFHCQAGEQSVLGAATAILPSGSRGPLRGWLMHLSGLQRPSYNEAINSAFKRINATIEQSLPPKGVMAASISELLPPGEGLSLRPGLPHWKQQLLALQGMAPGWIGVNGLLLASGAGALLALRQLRLRDQLLERARRNQLRLLRQVLPGPLLSRQELLEAIQQLPATEDSELWIAAMQVTVMLFHDAVGQRHQARTEALARLGERLQQLSSTCHLALGEDSTLLQVLQVTSAEATEEQRLIEQELERLQQAMADAMQLSVSGILTRLDITRLPQQLLDLTLLLSQGDSGGGAGGVQKLPEGVAEQARELRRQLSRDFTLTRSIETLQDHRCALEPVLELEGNEQRLVYSEMLFRLPQELEGSITVQELVLALERNNNIHVLDQLMVRQAISLLRSTDPNQQRLGVNLSALSFTAEKPLQALFAQLRSLPESLRRRLVLEVTETALLQKPDAWAQRLQQLRDFGVQIAIDDFGVGFASIAYLFQFQPDFLKLDLSYTQRLNDSNVDALVAFLLRYTELNRCSLILEGIETEEQLRYWQARGVRQFQGYWFHR